MAVVTVTTTGRWTRDHSGIDTYTLTKQLVTLASQPHVFSLRVSRLMGYLPFHPSNWMISTCVVCGRDLTVHRCCLAIGYRWYDCSGMLMSALPTCHAQ